MRRRWKILTVYLCAVILFCNGCRKRVVEGPEEQLSERHHQNVPSIMQEEKEKETVKMGKEKEEEQQEKEERQNTFSETEEDIQSEGQSTAWHKKSEEKQRQKKGETEKTDLKKEKIQKKEMEKNDNREKKSEERREEQREETESQKNTGEVVEKRDDTNGESDGENNVPQNEIEESGQNENLEGGKKPQEDFSGEGNKEEENKKDVPPKETPSSEQSPTGMDKEFGIIVDQYKKDFANQMTIYPCQFLAVYYETKEDFVTVNAGSQEQKIIQDAAAENVGTDLGKNNLTINAEWIKKKNPELIIKCVDSSVLGENVSDMEEAEQLCKSIEDREGWSDLKAVQNKNIMLLSEELLKTEQGKLMMKYYVASVLHPELFGEVKLDDIKKELLGEKGIYEYHH